MSHLLLNNLEVAIRPSFLFHYILLLLFILISKGFPWTPLPQPSVLFSILWITWHQELSFINFWIPTIPSVVCDLSWGLNNEWKN